MSNATLTDLQIQLAAHTDIIAPIVEGFRDVIRALGKPDEQAIRTTIQAHVDTLQRRLDLVATVQAALMKLDADGFDQVADLVLSADAYVIWHDQLVTHQAADARTKGLDPDATAGTLELTNVVPA
jgi:hypothetical protein